MGQLDVDRFYYVESFLESDELVLSASELHGIITGIICAGVPMDGKSWKLSLHNLLNPKEKLPKEILDCAKSLYEDTCQSLIDSKLEFLLLMPKETAKLEERAQALADWVSGFLAGFSVNCVDYKNASKDVKEMLQDLTEIAKISISQSSSKTNDSDYENVTEYVRIVALSCFCEFGQNQDKSKKIIH